VEKLIVVGGIALAVCATGATAAGVPALARANVTPVVARQGASSPCRGDPVTSMALAEPSPAPPSRLRLRGQKWAGRQLQRSEAGLAWSVSPQVTLELNYERSALAPMMRRDHDDGILTRLKLGF
jgi:hypothetical protein